MVGRSFWFVVWEDSKGKYRSNTISIVHPVEWLIEARERLDENIRLLFWAEISEEINEKYYDEL